MSGLEPETLAAVSRGSRYRLVALLLLLLLLLLLAIGVPIGWLLGRKLRDAGAQREVIATIRQLGGEAYFDYEADGQRQGRLVHELAQMPWLRNLLGDDFFYPVRRVDLSGTAAADSDLEQVARLAGVRSLNLRGTRITDAGLGYLLALNHLEYLDLRDTAVTLEAVGRLRRRLQNVEVLYDQSAQPAQAFVRRARRKAATAGQRDTGLGEKGQPHRPGAEGGVPVGKRPSLRTEKAIEMGLSFLARRQWPDGRWSLNDDPDEPVILRADTAATGLALLAFLGAGYDHLEGPYQDVVRRGLGYLLEHQHESGDLYLPDDAQSSSCVWLYSHGIASIALCEAYGMTQDDALYEPAQRAIDFIVAAQHVELGGWRYRPGFSADTSVTGWMMMALRSGQLAGLQVPPEAFQRIGGWLDRAQASPTDRHLYVYNPLAPDTPEQRHGRRPNETMTAVGLLMRLYGHWRRDHPDMVRGAAYLLEHLPQFGTSQNPRRDSYYWYYATQVMLHMRGDCWQQWNAAIYPLLVQSQVSSGARRGSWDPRHPVADRWAAHAGRLYVTTLNLLTLEVYYRYLPIYEDMAR